MNKKIQLLILFVLILVSCNTKEHESQTNKFQLWFDRPAKVWTEALPIGNGRLGAMIYGDVNNELLQLNEESLWAGTRINNNNPEALKNLKQIQELLLEGNSTEAEKIAVKTMLGTPPRIRSYQTLGNLNIERIDKINSSNDFRRELNLNDGIHTVKFKSNNIEFIEEALISAVDNILVVHLASSQKGKLNYNISLTRKIDAEIKIQNENKIILTGQIDDKDKPETGPIGKHMKFSAILEIKNEGGEKSKNDSSIIIKNADEITILLTAATDYNLNKLNFDRTINPLHICENILSHSDSKSYNTIKQDHISEHRSIFNRVNISLGDSLKSNLPTDLRLEKLKSGEKDPELAATYFQYGRYLLMNSSRSPGILPANLQGIWNEHFEAPWNSDFHTNINLQMNYWPAEVCNLPETVIPLTKFFEKVKEPGSVTAKEMYNAKGWMMHHLTDPFGRTGLMDGVQWGTSPLAGAWMALTFWEHYQFTKDKDYLTKDAYPLMKGAAEFILDFLIVDKNGRLVTAPSVSPENSFISLYDGKRNQITFAATIDLQIIHELFNACIESAKILNDDPAFIEKLSETQKKLPPILIGKDGTIREWIEDYEEVEPGHRHMSHLFGLHPGSQITTDTPELFEAAKKTIEKRLSNGGGHTGWSRAWIINFYDRLLDSENAYNHFIALLQKSTLPNLFDTHPPFQIDGNFGGTAGIAEMFLQSQNNIIRILPALPKEWQDGFITGLKARGNFTIDIFWKSGKLEKVKVISNVGGLCKMKYKDKDISFSTAPKNDYLLDQNFELIN